MKTITIKGASAHNLKGFDVSIPKGILTVVTGVSGSGKSSLVFDIIFEEGRRQYLQSLGILAGVDDEHKFDSITGISPAIAVQQNIIRQSNPRSTVGSRTHLLNMLGAFYAGEGQITCYACETLVGEDLICPTCGNLAERLPSRYFSYNDPNGMCIKCSGRGYYYEINMQNLIPKEQTTLQDIVDYIGMTPGYINLLYKKYSEYFNIPFFQIPPEVQVAILYGSYSNPNPQKRPFCLEKYLQGQLFHKANDSNGSYIRSTCTDCQGYRVGEEARRVLIRGKHIGKLAQMTLTELRNFLKTVQKEEILTDFSQNLLTEMLHKIQHLVKIRLGHLSLYREMPNLSGGEIQRLFLSSHLESRMDSLIYILDEPTAGLHESEKSELLDSIYNLKELGNTVIVVEHDRNTIEKADNILDIGPKAGIEGGEVIYQGDLKGLLQNERSITGQYLCGKINQPSRKTLQDFRINEQTPCLTIRHASINNLKDVTACIPLEVLAGIAGVSGSGKSSLISNTLIPLLKNHFQEPDLSEETELEEEDDLETVGSSSVNAQLDGIQYLSGYAEVSQAPIGRNSNSNPASYIGIWEKIRRLYARQPEAVQQQLSAGHFSFNSRGACPECKGSGSEKIWLGGNSYLEKTCKVCMGKRYSEETLSVYYQGKNISDILEMSVSEAVNFFADQKTILSTLKVMDRIGMGYIKLGQPTPTLSGGEAQRIKLAKEIGRRRKGNILYVLDEPTTGLSLYDIDRLIQLMDELVKKGNSVIVVEHDTTVLSLCDWLIELGPGGGTEGGYIISEGTPQSLKNNPNSKTGSYLL